MRGSIWLLGLILALTPAPAETNSQPQFERDVLPVLNARCGSCHGPKMRMAGLDLHEASLVLRGSLNGPVIAKGSPEKSLLIKRIREGSMPPGGKDRLSEAEIAAIENWVRAGAPSSAVVDAAAAYHSQVSAADRQFWAFRPIAPVAVPQVSRRDQVSTPVDAFLLSKLEQKQLAYAQPATRATLARRAYLDLLGLPPTPAEVAAFVNDPSPQAYPALVDRLLASPHFGERWGRHWLDLAGYVDTVGRDVQSDGYKVGEGRWKYRDYVIRAFNHDKPYNRFLTEQIAGDELFDWRRAETYTPGQIELLTATGFLRTVEDPTDNPERDTPLLRYEVLHQTEEILTTSVLGLTVACARCHNHKFDPISQQDYYSLMAILSPAYNPVKWTPVLQRTLASIPPAARAEVDQANAAIDKALQPLQAEHGKILNEAALPLIDAALAKLPEAGREKARNAALAVKRTAAQKKLVAALGIDLSDRALASRLNAEQSARLAALDKQMAELAKKRRSYDILEALYDTGEPPETYIHRRGDFESKGDVVHPAGLEVLSQPGQSLDRPDGRRLALAEWLTKDGTRAASLVARVYVNRVWMHLFGQGIVATPENFGKMGTLPTHPELLEWLSGEFVRGGWSTRRLIRTMMLSTAYQQASKASGGPEAARADPDNTLLWRMPLRRLESEVIRDSMLSIAGTLNPKMGGEPVKTVAEADGMVTVDEKALADPADRYRRSVYLVARRRYNLSMLGVFDHPVMSTNATTRGASAVVLQSLMMMNDKEVLEQSAKFAARLLAEAGPHAGGAALLELAWRYTYGRGPDADEMEWARGCSTANGSAIARQASPLRMRRLWPAFAMSCSTPTNFFTWSSE